MHHHECQESNLVVKHTGNNIEHYSNIKGAGFALLKKSNFYCVEIL